MKRLLAIYLAICSIGYFGAWVTVHAQQRIPESHVIATACVGPQWTSTCPKVNGQCPVCGWQAKPYKADKRWCGDYQGGQPQGPVGLPGCEPRQTIIRCERCNAAFWQDSEN